MSKLNRDFTHPSLEPLEQANAAFKVARSDVNDAKASVYLAASAVDWFFRKGPVLNIREREAIKGHLRDADAALVAAQDLLTQFVGTGPEVTEPVTCPRCGSANIFACEGIAALSCRDCQHTWPETPQPEVS